MRTPAARRRRRTPLQGLVRLSWAQPLWAVPFALFFGLINERGRGPEIYLLAYKVAVVMAYTIGLALWGVEHYVMPRVRRDSSDPARAPEWRIGATYVAVAVAASYVGFLIVHVFFLPEFLISGRSWLISGLYSLVFSGLFGGLSLAGVFHRQAVERARAVETMRAELAEAELRALRAQINPHFLFNTLNSIAALIRADPVAAEETTTRLADVFRYTLRASDADEARLGDEVKFLREYLAIERTRFGDRLRVEETVPADLEQVRVPSLLLQPLVENAVRYGISSRPEGGTLRLAARRDGELVRISIADDGPGMNASSQASGTGFGLHSVRERLRAAGPPHALDIRSAPGHGTEIEVTLPLRLAREPRTFHARGEDA